MKLTLVFLIATMAYGQTLATTGQSLVRFQSIAHNGSYTVVATDMGQQLTANTTVAWAIPQAGTTGFEADKYVYLNNVGTGVITLTPATSTVTGCGVTAATAITVPAYSSMRVLSSAGNYIADMCGGGGGTNPTGTTSGVPYWLSSGPTTGAWSNVQTPLMGSGSYLQLNGYNTGAGSANAQTVTLTGCPTSLSTGIWAFWLPVAANTTTTPTLAVCGYAAKTITKNGTAALAASDLTTTAVAWAIYDGTEWQLQNPQTSSGGIYTVDGITLQTCGTNEFCANTGVMATRSTAAGGTDTTCPVSATGAPSTLTCSMSGNALTAYVNGMSVRLYFAASSGGGATTLNVNGLGAVPLYANGSTVAVPVNPATLAADTFQTAVFQGDLNSGGGAFVLQSGIPWTTSSSDPGCTASGNIGKVWFDTTTSTTGFKVCKSVSGTVGWSLVTTVP